MNFDLSEENQLLKKISYFETKFANG